MMMPRIVLLLCPALLAVGAERPGALLARGVGEFRQGDYAAASNTLARAEQDCSPLCDYVRYFHARSLAGLKPYARSADLLAEFGARFPDSPMLADAVSLRIESRLLSLDTADARRDLEASSGVLAEPARLLLRVRTSVQAGDRPGAIAAHRELSVRHPLTREATEAAALVRTAPPLSEIERLDRARHLFELAAFAEARNEYLRVAKRAKGARAEQAAVGAAAADLRSGAAARACATLRQQAPADPSAAAERLYYLVECGRRQDRRADVTRSVQQLAARFPESPWYADVLMSAGNYFLLRNEADESQAMFRRLVAAFPRGKYAPAAHWKIAWRAYLERQPQARALLGEHVQLYSAGPHTAAAMYWLARLSESGKDRTSAASLYQKLLASFPLHSYGLRAARRLENGWGAVNVPARRTGVERPPAAIARRIERARLLRALSLGDLAAAELTSADPNQPGAYFIGLELADEAVLRGRHHEAIRALKRFTPGYLRLPIHSLPQRFWEMMYPLPWKDQLVRAADRYSVNAVLLAALIRQESEFNPAAVSRAGARGLMQIMPATGVLLGLQAQAGRVGVSALHTPGLNIRLGTLYLRNLVDTFGGLEVALAGYNAGPSRARQWLGWAQFEDPEEFVETIPFTETREYVLAVLRNTEIYRRLYDLPGPVEAETAGSH